MHECEFLLDFISRTQLTCLIYTCFLLENCLVCVCIHHGECNGGEEVDVIRWEGADVEDCAVSCSPLSEIALGLDLATEVE